MNPRQGGYKSSCANGVNTEIDYAQINACFPTLDFSHRPEWGFAHDALRDTIMVEEKK
jgi:hypothetical protein